MASLKSWGTAPSSQHLRYNHNSSLCSTVPLCFSTSAGSALKCYHCVARNGGSCTTTTETCGYKKDTCVSAHFTNRPFTYFRRCISWSDCLILQDSDYVEAKCCQSDLCN
ncbi:phospholipase A2 inhibitor and Ly6/PLAUR domain-containing protein-like [Neoarius graeffei]|uniref:phospholipase A2 inhibitor and Ly6/PLAUR domain-containing protein-like n=1 Tax=Neoarius graeffei TaxID=443677 RepID=UPI00298D27F0|nr:phospholipase A2 inhibitor and Ly6/PLAUR domain-containing protein-like [Neoarius graeffei]